MKILVTGGTVFVSKYIAQYYVNKGDEVVVLNRNTRQQIQGVNLIEADRHCLNGILKDKHFDLVIDTAYTPNDVTSLISELGSYHDYVLISSSAVYPESGVQPFLEEATVSKNIHWGKYGVDKIETEKALFKENPNAYSIRPPYIYGPMNNVYREAFVFECAMHNRKFYLPNNGEMKLQFVHIEDMCKLIDAIIDKHPQYHILNVGNKECISVREWVELCYEIVGKKVEFVEVDESVDQLNYFSFKNYEYVLETSKQVELIGNTIPLIEGFKQSFEWYKDHQDEVNKKPFIDYIDNELINIE